MTSPTPESQAEAKVTREPFNGVTASTNPLDDLLGKFSLTKTLRIVAWAVRFVQNARPRDWSKSTGGGGGPEQKGGGSPSFQPVQWGGSCYFEP